MTLRKLLEVMGAGAFLHIGAERGRGWCFSDTVTNLTDYLPDDWKDREIVQMYPHEGREGSRYCRELKPGIAVVVEGYGNGVI